MNNVKLALLYHHCIRHMQQQKKNDHRAVKKCKPAFVANKNVIFK